MGIATENVKGIIAAAHPNANLMHKANEKQEIAAQQAKEQRFYDKITMVDPVTKQPITNIEQLNDLILHLDKIYNLGALLPSGSINGGEVERRLSQKYNLKLRGKNKFTRTEQASIKNRLQALANEAFNMIAGDQKIIQGITKAAEKQLWPQILAYMGAIQVNAGIMTLFISTSWESSNIGGVKDIYEDLLNGKEVEAIRMKTFGENVVGSGRTGKRGGFDFIRDHNDLKQTQDIIGIEINPDLNKLSDRAFSDFYEFAIREGLLESNIELNSKNSLGAGTKSPMDVSPEEWRKDVFQAVREALVLDEIMPANELEAILEQYHVADEIALGRSLNNLRGFMGELRAIIIVHLLFPTGNNALLGTAKVMLENSVHREDAPIDVMVTLLQEAFGIQVKNISDLESYSWGNFREASGMTVPNFYAERLQSGMDGSETNFFGAYVYNQPVSNYPNPYEAVYGGFQSTFNSVFTPVYQKLALYIIRQTTKIKSSNNPLLSGTLTNDFFFMNNKIVPASSFMTAMSNGSDMITSSFTLVPAPKPGYYRSAAKQPADYGSYANQASIRYSIDVQFSRLLTSAYNGV